MCLFADLNIFTYGAFYICIFYTVGQNDVPEEDIIKQIFNKYNHQARPGTSIAPTVNVDHTLSLLRIADLVSITYI